jgi:hypothetical protein
MLCMMQRERVVIRLPRSKARNRVCRFSIQFFAQSFKKRRISEHLMLFCRKMRRKLGIKIVSDYRSDIHVKQRVVMWVDAPSDFNSIPPMCVTFRTYT